MVAQKNNEVIDIIIYYNLLILLFNFKKSTRIELMSLAQTKHFLMLAC